MNFKTGENLWIISETKACIGDCGLKYDQSRQSELRWQNEFIKS